MQILTCELHGDGREDYCSSTAPYETDTLNVDITPCVYGDYPTQHNVLYGEISVEEFAHHDELTWCIAIGIFALLLIPCAVVMTLRETHETKVWRLTMLGFIAFVLVCGVASLFGAFSMLGKLHDDSDITCTGGSIVAQDEQGTMTCATFFRCDGEDLVKENSDLELPALMLFLCSMMITGFCGVLVLLSFVVTSLWGCLSGCCFEGQSLGTVKLVVREVERMQGGRPTKSLEYRVEPAH